MRFVVADLDFWGLQAAGWRQFRKGQLHFCFLVGHKSPQLPAHLVVRLRVGNVLATSWQSPHETLANTR
jgi:hypothetical protein